MSYSIFESIFSYFRIGVYLVTFYTLLFHLLFKVEFDIGRSFCSGRTPEALVKTINYSKFRIILVIPVCNLTLPFTLPYFLLYLSPYLTFPYITLHITLHYLTLPYLTLPYLTLPYHTLCLTLPYHTLCLTLPYYTLPYLNPTLYYPTLCLTLP